MDFEIKYTRDIGNLLTSAPQKRDHYMILLCLQGSVSIKIGYHNFELQPKMISILSPDMIFSSHHASVDLEVIQLLFQKSFLQKIFLRDDIVNELLLLSPNYPPVYELEDSFDPVWEKFKQVEKELDTRSAYHLDLIRLVIIEILYEYNRACEYCLLGFKKNMNRNYQLTYQFKKMVDEHFLQWRAIGDYAAQLGITAKHLTEVIKEETGCTALQVIHERLLLESQYLLKHTAHSIKQCAYLLGFDTPSYFTHFFKSNAGITPFAYRRNP